MAINALWVAGRPVGADFWALWLRHRNYLYKRCVGWLAGNRHDAEDVLSKGAMNAAIYVRDNPGGVVRRHGRAAPRRRVKRAAPAMLPATAPLLAPASRPARDPRVEPHDGRPSPVHFSCEEIVLAVLLSPEAWAGKTHVIHLHVHVAVILGGALSAVPIALVVWRPGWIGTRMAIACAQMLWSALLIHLSGDRIEAQFHIFGSLAFLTSYHDWRVFVPATLLVLLDHIGRQLFWPESIFGVLAPEPWRFLEYVAWVVFEETILILACVNSLREMKGAAVQQTKGEARERLEKQLLSSELAIATAIQTSVLPRDRHLPGLEWAARMILPAPGGCWIGIGDVAGHGLQAGLVMLQAQSAIEALILSQPDGDPTLLLAPRIG